jgi:DNA-binding response OmpR family regulator
MQTQSPLSQFAKLLALDANIVSLPEYVLKTDVCTIGRHRTCDIVVYQEIASRLHAEIKREGPRYVLHDKSTNGTFVNNSRINKPHLLRSGDLIGLGQVTPLLRFYDPADDPTPLAPLLSIDPVALRFDKPTMTFFLDEQPLDLTPKEFRLLSHLYQHAGEVCDRESCAQVMWGQDYDDYSHLTDWNESLNRKIADLRGKFRQINSTAAKMIETRRTLGYVLNLGLSPDL